jgi:Reverse transcriptase (RNA-dependent DNA polymerase)
LANTKAQETVEQDKKKDKGSKVIREMKKLQGWFNPYASRGVESSNSGREPIIDQADIAFITVEQPKEPGTFNEAFNHPEEDVRLKWREAIHKEFKEMNLRGVWKKASKEDMPVGRRCVNSKWVSKVKRKGVFWARLVACEYSQVPGVDFNDSFATVLNNVSFRVLLIAKLVWKLKARIINVEPAFLHGDLKEEIFMEIPPGMEASKDERLILKKTILSSQFRMRVDLK